MSLGAAWRWLLAGVVVVGILAGAALERLRAGPGLPSGSRELPGLSEPVDVLWDSLGIPHVFAALPADALRAQGWLHGHQRLWQVEMFRRVAQGRLSELFGEAAIPSDGFLRTLGMDRAAAAGEALLEPATRALVEAYAGGLTAAVEGWRGPRPPELLVLGGRPEPYRVRDALALEKIMAWDLAEYELSLELAAAYRELGPEGWERVRPRYPEDGVTILEAAGAEPVEATPAGATPADASPADASPVGSTGGARELEAPLPPMDARLVAAARVPESARSFLRAASIVRASNAWVVGPERSASGRPLLANDMHLGLRAPTLWYLVGLHAPGLEVVGMSLPGTPGVIAGRGRAVAWGFTNASLDDTDLFRERVDPIDTTRYLIPGGSEPFRVRQEEIRVRGRAEPVTVRVRETRHGPVIGDVEARAGGELLALRWVALDASTTPAALLAMNAAASAGTFVEALRGFVDPHQNVVFADTAGVWGYWMAGRVPRRRGGTPPLLPVPGWTGEHDWDGYLGFDEHPHALSPPAGVVVTANHRQTRAPVGARISDGAWTEPYRALRILELLEGRELHDAGTMAAIQLDVGSAFVNRHRAAAESAFREAGLDVEAGALEAWDGRATLEDTATGLFHAWFGRLRTALSEELYGRSDGFVPRAAVERALVEGRFPGETLRGAARAARDDTAGRPWGELHRLWLDHPLADVPVVGSLFGFGRGDLPREGGPHTVNVAGFDGRGVSFRVYDGPSQRHVVDLADPDGSGGFILPGGQSGFPGSPHHMDQLPRWARGELVPLPLERTAVEARTVTRLRLVPPG